MKLDSPKQIVDKSAQEVYEFLDDVKNFEKIMPESVIKFEMLSEDSFIFALSGMPEVALKKRESNAPNTIVFGAAGGKMDFNLIANIAEVSANSSEVQMVFSGEFNAMIGMMIKKPINKMIETWVRNIPQAI